jgi:hypothetical protein
VIRDVATCLAQEAAAAWTATGRAQPPAQLVVGDVSYDSCCPDGLLIVSVDQLVWYNPFPVEQLGQVVGAPMLTATPQPCRGTLGAYATVHVGLCIPVLDERGRAPDAEVAAAAMLDVLDLTEVVANGISCPPNECWLVGIITWGGTEGGCLVGQISVRLDGRCDPCP